MAYSPLKQLFDRLADGTQKSQRVDGSGNVTPAGDAAARGVYMRPTDGTNPLFPASSTATDADAAASATAVHAHAQGWDDTANAAAGGWGRLRIGAALHTLSTGVRSAITGLLHVFPFGIARSTAPTFTDQQIGSFSLGLRGGVLVQETMAPKYEDDTNQANRNVPAACSDTTRNATVGSSGTTKIGTAEVSVKSTAGTLYWASGVNTHATNDYYLVGVDKTAAVANNDATVFATMLPNTGTHLPAVPHPFPVNGKAFANAIKLAISTTPEKVTFPGSSDCVVFWERA